MRRHRLINASLLIVFLAFSTGLMQAAHLHEEGPSHDSDHCAVCQALLYTKATVPDTPALLTFDLLACGPRPIPAVDVVPIDGAGDPVVPRAPPCS